MPARLSANIFGSSFFSSDPSMCAIFPVQTSASCCRHAELAGKPVLIAAVQWLTPESWITGPG